MQYRSTKVTANTTISSTSSLFYGILLVSTGGGGTLPAQLKVYDATSAANQVGQFTAREPETSTLYRSLNIVCKTGLRVECADWTDLEVYVLHA